MCAESRVCVCGVEARRARARRLLQGKEMARCEDCGRGRISRCQRRRACGRCCVACWSVAPPPPTSKRGLPPVKAVRAFDRGPDGAGASPVGAPQVRRGAPGQVRLAVLCRGAHLGGSGDGGSAGVRGRGFGGSGTVQRSGTRHRPGAGRGAAAAPRSSWTAQICRPSYLLGRDAHGRLWLQRHALRGHSCCIVARLVLCEGLGLIQCKLLIYLRGRGPRVLVDLLQCLHPARCSEAYSKAQQPRYVANTNK